MTDHIATPNDNPMNYNTAVIFSQNDTEITEKMIECFSLRETVKILSAIDIFFGLVYSISNIWFIIPALIGFLGYFGAKNYNQTYVLSYFIYITLDWVIKLWLYIYVTSDPSLNNKYNISTLSLSFAIIMTLVDIWISKIVFKFWRCLRNMSVIELQSLKGINNMQYRIVYW